MLGTITYSLLIYYSARVPIYLTGLVSGIHPLGPYPIEVYGLLITRPHINSPITLIALII